MSERLLHWKKGGGGEKEEGLKSGRSANELEWGVGRYHCPGGKRGWRPEPPPVGVSGIDASLPSPGHRPGLSPSLSLSFLRPLTGSPTTFLERGNPPPPRPAPRHHRGGYTFHFPFFQHQPTLGRARAPSTPLPTPNRRCRGGHSPDTHAPRPRLEQRQPRM